MRAFIVSFTLMLYCYVALGGGGGGGGGPIFWAYRGFRGGRVKVFGGLGP